MKSLIFGGGSDMAPPILSRFPGVALTHADCDVRYTGQVLDAFHRHPDADLVVNLAGVSSVGHLNGQRHDYGLEITTNLIGPFNIARAAALFNPDATLVFIASVAGMYGKPNHAGYSASKAGVISLVQSMGMEGYLAYAISPGRVDTKMRERDYPGEDPRTRLTVEQVAEVVEDIVARKYQPGDNVVIRKIGFDTFLRVDRGEPWREWLNVRPEAR